jgi:hypothetical protein
MDYKTFRGLSLHALGQKTGIPGEEWSRYFNCVKRISEVRLERAGEALCIESSDLLRFIQIKRAEKHQEKADAAKKAQSREIVQAG